VASAVLHCSTEIALFQSFSSVDPSSRACSTTLETCRGPHETPDPAPNRACKRRSGFPVVIAKPEHAERDPIMEISRDRPDAAHFLGRRRIQFYMISDELVNSLRDVAAGVVLARQRGANRAAFVILGRRRRHSLRKLLDFERNQRREAWRS